MNLLNKNIFLLLQIMICNHSLFSQDCNAVLNINSDIENVNIYINDEFAGEGSVFTAEIDTGTYLIKVSENSLEWGAATFVDTLKIADCKAVDLTYNFNNEVLIDTEPQDVYVFSADSLIGYTPLLLTNNFDKLLLQKNGYEPKTINFSDLQNDGKIKLNFIGEYRKAKFIESIWFKVLVGTAVALGATTAFYKLEADKNFDEYQITGDPALLDKTDQYDLISGITFTALQINFGLIIYFILTD